MKDSSWASYRTHLAALEGRSSHEAVSYLLVGESLLQLQCSEEVPDCGIRTLYKAPKPVVPPFSKVWWSRETCKAAVILVPGEGVEESRSIRCSHPSGLEVAGEGIHVGREGWSKGLPGVVHVFRRDEGKRANPLKGLPDVWSNSGTRSKRAKYFLHRACLKWK